MLAPHHGYYVTFKGSGPQNKILRSRNQASESTQLRVTRVFFLSLLSRYFDDQLSSNFTGLLFDAHVEIYTN